MSQHFIDAKDHKIKQQNQIEHLQKIIITQARLAEADFDVCAFMNLVVNQMQSLTPATGVAIEIIEDGHLVYRAVTGTLKKFLGLRLPLANSLSGLCIQSQKILASADTEKDPRVNLKVCRTINARSMVTAPLLNNGQTVGVLKILSDTANAFNSIDLQTLQLMAGLIGSALAHQLFYETKEKLLLERTKMLENLKKAENRLQYQAYHDYLTDLPNRAFFHDKLLTAMANTRKDNNILALMYMDIDHFKKINDKLGHAIGDTLLQAFSARLQSCIDSSHTAARFGGDEFVLLLSNLDDDQTALRMAKKILKKLREPYDLLNTNLNITTSIGIAFFKGEDISPDALLSQADQALYAAKNAGRNTIDIFKKSEISSEEFSLI